MKQNNTRFIKLLTVIPILIVLVGIYYHFRMYEYFLVSTPASLSPDPNIFSDESNNNIDAVTKLYVQKEVASMVPMMMEK